MTLSKEARILLAIFGTLGLGFAGLHFSTQFGEPREAEVNTTAVSTAVPNRNRANSANGANSANVAPLSPQRAEGRVEERAAQDEPRVARDLEIAQLPFLVTSPPPAPETSTADADLGAEAGQMPTTQASRNQRASVNPFSPLVVAEAPTPDISPDAGQRITEVPVQPQPQVTAAPTPRRAPIPSARTPDTSGTLGAVRLPRSLPNGTLASTPDVLRATLNTPVNAQRTQNPLAADTDELSSPLAAGSSPLSLYLRDQEVTFTGAVLGPVSVGIFRSADAPAPFLVPLGQTLPNTDIVLTDLTGQQAELTQDDNSQLLILDLRR